MVVKSFLTMGFGISDTLHLETDGLRCGNVSTLFMLGQVIPVCRVDWLVCSTA